MALDRIRCRCVIYPAMITLTHELPLLLSCSYNQQEPVLIAVKLTNYFWTHIYSYAHRHIYNVINNMAANVFEVKIWLTTAAKNGVCYCIFCADKIVVEFTNFLNNGEDFDLFFTKIFSLPYSIILYRWFVFFVFFPSWFDFYKKCSNIGINCLFFRNFLKSFFNIDGITFILFLFFSFYRIIVVSILFHFFYLHL